MGNPAVTAKQKDEPIRRTISISRSYLDVCDILDNLPKNEGSRFVCEAIRFYHAYKSNPNWMGEQIANALSVTSVLQQFLNPTAIQMLQNSPVPNVGLTISPAVESKPLPPASNLQNEEERLQNDEERDVSFEHAGLNQNDHSESGILEVSATSETTDPTETSGEASKKGSGAIRKPRSGMANYFKSQNNRA